jgi:hypothetical protein
VTWVTALILMALALPPLLARLAGGYPPNPGPELAALALLAVVPAVAAVIIATFAVWWLAALLAIPAVLLVVWQLPPLRRARSQAASWPSGGTGSAATTIRLRLFTLNAKGGAAFTAIQPFLAGSGDDQPQRAAGIEIAELPDDLMVC